MNIAPQVGEVDAATGHRLTIIAVHLVQSDMAEEPGEQQALRRSLLINLTAVDAPPRIVDALMAYRQMEPLTEDERALAVEKTAEVAVISNPVYGLQDDSTLVVDGDRQTFIGSEPYKVR